MAEYRRVMVFIDGGYLRKGLVESGFREEWDSPRFYYEIIRRLVCYRHAFEGKLIRAYYYDANFDPDQIKGNEKLEDRYQKNKELFEKINFYRNHEVKLGYLASSSPLR